MAKSKRYWRNKADIEWKRIILETGHCERCLRTDKQLHSHHLIKRVNLAYRHNLSNGVCLCASCHTLDPWAVHNDLTNFNEWLEIENPGQWIWYLEHTYPVEKVVGNEILIVRNALPMEHRGDEVEYNELKEVKL